MTDPDDEAQTGIDKTSPGRRRFLSAALVGGISAPFLVGFAKQPNEIPPLEVPHWTTTQGRANGVVQYGQPSAYEHLVHRKLPSFPDFARSYIPPQPGSSWAYTPWQDLDGWITPNGLFYERHHGGVPDIDPAQHRLVVHGMVEQDLLFDMEHIARFPAASRFHFLECSGNTDTEWHGPTARTAQESHGLMSCCQWTGVPLRHVLNEAGIRAGAKWVIAEGADAAAMQRSIPIEMALDDCLLVYAQNGERLRPEQGYPLRLLVPGGEGNANVKWLRRLEVTDIPVDSREETSKYTDLNTATGLASQFTIVMQANSIVTSPSGEMILPEAKGTYEVRGVAWSGRGTITGVDVTFDGGRNWIAADLDGPALPKCAVSFRHQWKWDGAGATIASRARDDTGYVQPTHAQLVKARGSQSSYHYNGIHAWEVHRGGAVTRLGSAPS